MFGLDPDTIRNIKQAFAKIPDIDRVILYGSRAKGNYRNGSDIDITLMGKKMGESLTLNNSVYPLMDELEELYLPYMFDISIFSDIDNENLIEHINRAGKVFYQREKELPKGWEVKKLREVIKLEYGKPLDKCKRSEKGKYPVYGANGIKTKASEYYYDKKTIIIGRKGSAGEINLTEEKFWPLDVTYFIKFEKKQIDLHFLYFLLSKLDLPKLAKGVKPGINRNDIYDFKIPLPPLPEQKRIVAILDQAFTVIAKAKANTEQNLKNAREVFQLKLQAIFDNGKLKIENGEWEEKKLGESFKLKSGDGLTSKNMVQTGDYSVYGGNGITGKHNKFNVKNDSVIIGRVGALCGIAINIVNKKIWLTDNAFKVINYNFEFYNPFLTYLLNHVNLRDYARQAAQPVISNSSLKNVVLNFPNSLIQQKEIAKNLDALSTETKKLETIYQQKINDLDELKKSILQKAFNGEL